MFAMDLLRAYIVVTNSVRYSVTLVVVYLCGSVVVTINSANDRTRSPRCLLVPQKVSNQSLFVCPALGTTIVDSWASVK